MPTSNETLMTRPNPYVGPRSFKKGEKLYGREQETAELLDLWIAERIVMLYAPSGAGKSSLLNACIFPGLEKNNFETLPSIRLNHEPPAEAPLDPSFNRYVYSALVSMEEAVAEQQRFSENDLATLSLKEYLARYRERAVRLNTNYDATRSLALIIDQGEEIITIDPTNRAAKQGFFNQLGQLLRDPNLWCLFALREDYVARLDSYIKPIPTGFSSRYRLRLLQASMALACVQKPAAEQGVEFVDEAAQKLIDDLREVKVQQNDGSTQEQLGLYVEPVQMQVVCRRLWTELDNDHDQITLEELKNFGDVDKALADYYNIRVAAVAAQTAVRERAVREWFDRKLITPQGIRGQVLMAPNASDGLENKAIWALEKDYLIRAEKRGGATWFELAHDRLIRPVLDSNKNWFEEHLSVTQRAADLWAQQNRAEGMLLFGKDYLAAAEWAKENADQLLPVEEEFLQACRNYYNQQQREKRTNLIVRILLGISLVALIVAVLMFIRAVQAQNLAETRQLAADSVGMLEINPQQSVILALQAMEHSDPPRPEAVDAMHRALPAVRLIRTLSGHSDRVYAVSVSPNGKWVASASRDGTVKVWEAQSGAILQDFLVNPDPNPESYGATSVAFSPDGKWLAAADGQGEIVLWDTATWQEQLRKFNAHAGVIWSIAFSPDSRLLASGGEDNLAKTWNLPDLSEAQTFSGHRKLLEAVTFSPDGSRLASASDDRSAKVWDAASGAEIASFTIPNHSINQPRAMSVAFSPDGSRLLVSSTDASLWLWDISSRQQLMRIWGHEDWVYGAAFLNTGEIVSAGADRSIRIWDGQYGRPLMELRGHTDQVFGIALSPDQQWLASAGADKTVRLWDISWAGNRETFTHDLPGYSEDIDYSPDGQWMAVATTADGEGSDPSFTEPGSVALYNAAGDLKTTLQGHKMAVTSVDFSPDGKSLVSTSWDKTAIVWDLSTYQPRLTLVGHSAQVFSADFSADGKRIVTGSYDGTLRFWDAATGRLLQTLEMESTLKSRRITQVQYNPQNSLLLVQVQDDSSLYLIDPQSGALKMRLIGQEDTVRDFDFSPDGNWLASVGDDANLIIWDLRPGTPDAARAVRKFREHFGTIYSITYSGDGKRILTGGADGLIKVWKLTDAARQSWEIEYTLRVYARGKDDTILDMEISPDNQQVSAVINDWTLRGYLLNDQQLMALARQRLTDSLTCAERVEYLKSQEVCR
ncbi:MAG: PQQ-binding-like beta-propeller repeat protein [Anaerolineales bacterium]